MEISLNIEIDSENICKSDINELFKYFQKLVGINKDISDKINTRIKNNLVMCSEFSELKMHKLDLSDWNVSGITDMHSMFNGCNELETITLNNCPKLKSLIIP
jgi:surface protein